MKFMYRIVMVILVVCIPVTAILSAYNVVFRLPDLYLYQFNSTQPTKEANLRVTSEELGEFFSDYMLGKNEEFSLVADFREQEQEAFTANEQATMNHIRALLNISLWVLAAGIMLTIAGYIILLWQDNKPSLRGAYKFCLLLYLLLGGLNIGAFYYRPSREWMRDFLFQTPFGEEEILPLMLTRELAQSAMFFALLGALVLLIVLGSITWRLTKPRRMFSH